MLVTTNATVVGMLSAFGVRYRCGEACFIQSGGGQPAPICCAEVRRATDEMPTKSLIFEQNEKVSRRVLSACFAGCFIVGQKGTFCVWHFFSPNVHIAASVAALFEHRQAFAQDATSQ
jgi:hypothetical protein